MIRSPKWCSSEMITDYRKEVQAVRMDRNAVLQDLHKEKKRLEIQEMKINHEIRKQTKLRGHVGEMMRVEKR